MTNIADIGFLVVEDHEFQRNILVGLLKGLGARAVHCAADGRDALRLLETQGIEVHVVISDLEMPGMDGMEFIRHLGSGRHRVSLILVSGHDRSLVRSVETMAVAYGANVLGAIEKPVDGATLKRLITRHGVPLQTPARKPEYASPYALAEILDGLEKNQFEPFFQPKLDVATRRVTGAEALARWRHPEHGIVDPVDFIGTLEESGQIDALMWMMLRKSVAFGNVLRGAGFASVVAVNISLKSLADADLARRVIEITHGYGIEPHMICLEVTESSLTTDVARALENLTRLRMKGFGLSIDDFGTGYSSMQQLTRIPFSELKIDGSFVTNACVRETTKVVLSSSLAMARQLNIAAVAEGVETQQDWDLLIELGCDFAQGYFIARPMAGCDYLNWQRMIESDPMTIAKNR